jgi:para-nitrobenzyl esterase
VQNNISHFGGDPRNVTVFGESSGAMSIGCLLGMPKSSGLFQKAILESGTGNMARPLSSAVSISQKFLELAGIKGIEVDYLRRLPVERLLALQRELTTVAPGGITPVAPVIDGTVLPDEPLAVVQSGSGLGVPIIVGNNLDENKISYLRQPDIKNMDQSTLYRLFGAILPNGDVSRFVDIYQDSRYKRGEPVEPHEIYSAIRSDASFRIPAIALCQAYHKNGQLAYNYLFTWESPILGGFLGACHTLEIGFVFGRMNPDLCGSGPRAEQLSKMIQESWLAFARHGKPDCQSLGNWPPYGEARKTMILGARCYVAEAVNEEERLAWESVVEDPVVRQ